MEAQSQNFRRACRRPQNGPSSILPVTILGVPVEMLLTPFDHGRANGKAGDSYG
jgi:hypothetical protein